MAGLCSQPGMNCFAIAGLSECGLSMASAGQSISSCTIVHALLTT